MAETMPGGPRETGPLTRTSELVFVEENTYAIANPEAPPERLTDPVGTGVVAVVEDGAPAASVTCGTHVGDVRITAETWSTAPPVDDVPWEDVAEISLPWAGGPMTLWGSNDDVSDEITLYEHAAPGSYRVRVHVRGRDLGEDRDEGDETEEHLLQVWSAEPAPHCVLKATDRTGDYWRSQ